MTNSKHTPGPWRVVVRANQSSINMVAVDMPPRGAWRPTKVTLTQEDVANARLIAAAPDMLDAIRLVADSGKFQCFDDDAWDVVNSAIAKAEGR